MSTPIRCVLIANRGEVVRRVARTARRMGLRTLGVYDADDAADVWLRDVDSAIALGDYGTQSPYLDIAALVAAALRGGADAVHPGYGFLAENADFAAACVDAGLTWIGPPHEAIRAMGLKIEAKQAARAAGVPVLESVEVGEDLDAAVTATESLQLPLLVKPSAGGGGKGMRLVRDRGEVRPALVAARREAISAFGDGTLFVERCLERARHVEVQLIADSHGTVLALGDRDCSVQRRHQKIIEEAPAPGLTDDIRARLRNSATALASAIGYRSAGTAEFLVQDDEIAFLELNTRLQVEHAVTEEVTGLDLVELQIRVAAGERLALDETASRPNGHAIEARLYAEDPANDFVPSPGRIKRFDAPEFSGVRWESAVAAGARVSPRYDPMIAKVIARADDRPGAIRLLRSALRELRVDGVRTNRDLLLTLLDSDELNAGIATTDLLDRRPELLRPSVDVELTRFHAAAAALGGALERHARATVQPFAPVGWRNVHSADQHVRLREAGGGLVVDVAYRAERDGTWRLTIDGKELLARAAIEHDGRIGLELDGLRRRCLVDSGPAEVLVDSPDAHLRFEWVTGDETEEEQGLVASALAPVPGIVAAVSVAPGDLVEAGDTLVVVEAMKMEHEVTALGTARVGRVNVRTGQSVEYQQLLVELVAEETE
jgi:propionyl-CoA carboxylase alpha chain